MFVISDIPTNLYRGTENSSMFCLVNRVYRGGLGKKDPKNPKKVVGYLILRHSVVSVPYRSDSLSGNPAINSDNLAETSPQMATSIAYR